MRGIDIHVDRALKTEKELKLYVSGLGPFKKLEIVITSYSIHYTKLYDIVGLYFELSNPGLILPGVLGGISLILALYAMQTLPINYAGLMLILSYNFV